jgi:hypothetical protein
LSRSWGLGGRRRSGPAAAAAANIPARFPGMRGNTRAFELLLDLCKTLEWSHDRRREGRGSSARRRPWRCGGGVLPASKGVDLLNRRWGMEEPSSLRRASYRPLLRSTASSLGRRALAGESATDRRARQCTVGGEVEGSTWRARISRASVHARPWEGARGLDAEAAYGARGRSGALERGRRRGRPVFFRTATV